MKTIASTSTLLLVCVGCGVLSLGFGSCDGSSSSGSPGTVPEGGLPDTGALRDVMAAADTGSTFEAGPHETGAPDAGEDAGYCGEPHTTLGTVCDGCIATSCEPMWCACATGTPDPDAGDAGTGCLQYAQCVEACVLADAGTPTDCLTTVCAVMPFTTPQQQAGHAFLDCLVQYCGSECGQ
jgi:hypothetical protein